MDDKLTISQLLYLVKKLLACQLYLIIIFLLDTTNHKGDFLLSNIMMRIRIKYCKINYYWPLKKA